MIITPQELAILQYSLDFSIDEVVHEGRVYYKPRTFATITEQKKAFDVLEKIKSAVKTDDKVSYFVETDLEFSTEEKQFILNLIDRPFVASDIAHKLSLYDKLK